MELKKALQGGATPFRANTWHALLQIVTLGMGSLFGARGGAACNDRGCGGKWSGYRGLSVDESRVFRLDWCGVDILPGHIGKRQGGNQLNFAALIDCEYVTGLLAAKWLAVILEMLADVYGGRLPL
ncbi:hypothetical protein [Neisseria iguanae]|uniref:hypothetical protein n=1 Tax=Neisseria iguanae TaxID=90242 RepID=UPI0011B2066A|nr:hypothetical protein [Neisseria iguanae]